MLTAESAKGEREREREKREKVDRTGAKSWEMKWQDDRDFIQSKKKRKMANIIVAPIVWIIYESSLNV